jgi:hypothetical protein
MTRRGWWTARSGADAVELVSSPASRRLTAGPTVYGSVIWFELPCRHIFIGVRRWARSLPSSPASPNDVPGRLAQLIDELGTRRWVPKSETADFTFWWRCSHCDSGHASRSPSAATPRPAGNPGVGNALAGQQHDPRSLPRAARSRAVDTSKSFRCHVTALHAVPTRTRNATWIGRTPRAALGHDHEISLSDLIACILGVAAALFVLMFRRDHGIHGLVGLTSGPPWRPAPAT